MFYCSADLLFYVTSRLTRKLQKGSKPRLKKVSKVVKYDQKNIAPGTPISGNYRYDFPYTDCMYAETIEDFGNNLINFKIGTLLNEDDYSSFLPFLDKLQEDNNDFRIKEKIKENVSQHYGNVEETIDTQKNINEENYFRQAKTYIFIKGNSG